jgi:hypothetical protein
VVLAELDDPPMMMLNGLIEKFLVAKGIDITTREIGMKRFGLRRGRNEL